jgi:hypothetical protein
MALLVTIDRTKGVEITTYLDPYMAMFAGKDWQRENNDNPNWHIVDSDNVTINGNTTKVVRT